MFTGDISDTDLLALIHGFGAIGGASPVDALAVLYSESGFDPTATNASGCRGVNQFCAASGVSLPDNYTSLSAADQLTGYVLPWWATRPKAALQSARDLYWVNGLPGTYKPGMPDSFVVTTDPALAQGILGPGATEIRAGDFSALIARRTNTARFHELAGRLASLGGAPPRAPSASSFDLVSLGLLGAAGLGVVMLAKR